MRSKKSCPGRGDNMKDFCKKHLRKMLALAMVMSMTLVTAFAAEGDTTGGVDTAAITSAFSTGLTNVVSTSISLISTMLPIALSLFAVLFICRKGMSWFKSMAK